MFCMRLKEERQRLGLTQPDFAKVADASKRTLIDWEKGVSAPNGFQLSALASIGVDVQYIITGQRSSNCLSSDEAFMLEKISQASLETRNKILMLLLSGGEMPTTSGVNNQDVVHGQQVGNDSVQTNNFNSGLSADPNIQGDVKIKSKGKRSQAAFNISNNEK